MRLTKHLPAAHETKFEGGDPERKQSAEDHNLGQRERFSLPPADELLEYERIVPGTSEWLCGFLDARRARYAALIVGERKRERGARLAKIFYAFILLLFSILASLYFLRQGAPISGAIMSATGAAVLAYLVLFSQDGGVDRESRSFGN
jgi:uncharacterized membrane protein